MNKVVILGSTGSIGENAVRVAQKLQDRIEVVGLAANSNVKRLVEQAEELNCRNLVIGNSAKFAELKKTAASESKIGVGIEALAELCKGKDLNTVLCAIVGTAGLLPVLEAVKAGKRIALASKEVLVMAGELVMSELKKHPESEIIPVDSEHSAIFQCLEGKKESDISKLILTASGGAFRNSSYEDMEKATFKNALNHPTWDMGPKVTIDSASLMNKALEIIEASRLFGIDGKNIDVIIHPQSIVHSMVEFIDGTILAQMTEADMRFPIQYALTYPQKVAGGLSPLNWEKLKALTFQIPDRKKFPSLDFAYFALESGGTMPAVMNAANEVAVEGFQNDEIKFTDIWKIIEKTMSSHKTLEDPELDAILSADNWARDFASEL